MSAVCAHFFLEVENLIQSKIIFSFLPMAPAHHTRLQINVCSI